MKTSSRGSMEGFSWLETYAVSLLKISAPENRGQNLPAHKKEASRGGMGRLQMNGL